MRAYLLALAGALLTSCATEYEVPAAVAGPIDSTFRAQGLPPRKVKFTGPVTLQIGGSGNNATAIAKAQAPVAAAPHATATQTTTKPRTPWYVYAGLVVVGAGLGAWLCSKFSLLSFFK